MNISEEYNDYIKRRLGWPVVEVYLDKTQIDDIIIDTLQSIVGSKYKSYSQEQLGSFIENLRFKDFVVGRAMQEVGFVRLCSEMGNPTENTASIKAIDMYIKCGCRLEKRGRKGLNI